MKKIIPYMLVLVFGNTFASVESPKLFPMSDITVGMSSKELMDKYPTERILFAKRNDDETLKGGLVMYSVSKSKFWDSLNIVIDNEKVGGLVYARINREMILSRDVDVKVDYSNVVKNIKPLFKQLKQELGSDFEKKVIYQSLTEARTRCAMYVWTRDKDVVTFIHSPVALHKKGSIFVCQVTITATLDVFSSEMATDSLPEDELLWADAMDEEEKGAFPNLWVYASIALCAFCATAYFIWRKRQ